MRLETIRFAQRQRLRFIESVAYWEGAVDRVRISSVFGVSGNHVTKDFRLYKEAFPENLQYDESSRVYRPTRRFKPRISKGSAEEYLSLLRTHTENRQDVSVPIPTGLVEADAVPHPHPRIDSTVLHWITRAIAANTGLAVTYQSRNSLQPSTRNIWPHALLFSGMRWHVRAHDDHYKKFIDLVPQRILSAKPIDAPSPQAPSEDKQWNTFITIDVIPARSLTVGQAAVIAQEFGMGQEGKKWVWRVQLRECLVGYFFYFYRLDLDKDPQRLIELRDKSIRDNYTLSSPLTGDGVDIVSNGMD